MFSKWFVTYSHASILEMLSMMLSMMMSVIMSMIMFILYDSFIGVFNNVSNFKTE